MIEMKKIVIKKDGTENSNKLNSAKLYNTMKKMGVGRAFENEKELGYFVDKVYEIGRGKKVTIAKISDKSYSIFAGRTRVAKIQGGKLTKLRMPGLTDVEDVDMFFAGRSIEYVTDAEFPDLVSAGEDFMVDAWELRRISMPSVQKLGPDCMVYAYQLEKFDAPSLIQAGDRLLLRGRDVREFNAPNFTKIGRYTLYHNDKMEEISLPNVRKLPIGFMYANAKLEEVNAHKLKHVDAACAEIFYDIVRKNCEKQR